MSTRYARFAAIAVALVVGACNGSAGGGTSPAASEQPVAVSSLTVTAVPEATTTPEDSSSGGQPTAGSIDPCTLMTSAEASTMMGKQLGAGVSQAADPDRECTFKNGLSEVKLILAPPAPDAATAQGYWDAERAQAPSGITITDVTLYDRAAYGSYGSGEQSLSALFVIKGQYFFDLYCGFPSCTKDASVAGAQLVGGRLP